MTNIGNDSEECIVKVDENETKRNDIVGILYLAFQYIVQCVSIRRTTFCVQTSSAIHTIKCCHCDEILITGCTGSRHFGCLLCPYSSWLLHWYCGNHHDDVIKWKHFPRYWPFVRGIHRSPVNSPHKGQWRGALMFCFHLRLNKRLSRQSWGWWFETPSHPLWRHCNDMVGFPSICEAVLKKMSKTNSSLQNLIMMTSSNGNIFRVTGPLCGEFTGPGEFSAQRPVTRSFGVFFDLCLE